MVYQPKISNQKPKVYGMNSLVLFGKYKPEEYTVRQLLSLDPNYVVWCIENHKGFEADPEVMDTAYQLTSDEWEDVDPLDEYGIGSFEHWK